MRKHLSLAIVSIFFVTCLSGCGIMGGILAPNLIELAEEQRAIDAATRTYAMALAEGWELRSGIIKRVLEQRNVPAWVFEDIQEINTYIAGQKAADLTDEELGEMVGLIIRFFIEAIEEYAPDLLRFAAGF